jgi:hypothetical protein
MVEARDAALDFFFGIALEQYRSCAVGDVQDHGVVILGLACDELVLRRKKYIDFGSAQIKFVSLPVAYDCDSQSVGFGDQVIECEARGEQTNPQFFGAKIFETAGMPPMWSEWPWEIATASRREMPRAQR